MKQWQPLSNGYNTGRIGNYEIQVGIDSGKLHIFNIRQNRKCWVIDLPVDQLAICRAVEVDTPQPVPVEAMRTILLEYKERIGPSLAYKDVSAWLDNLKGGSGGNGNS